MPRKNHASHARRRLEVGNGPTVLGITNCGTMANDTLIRAKVQYPGEAPQVVEFIGSPYGTPGPVLVLMDGMSVRVSDPARFGDRFGPGWVRRYWA